MEVVPPEFKDHPLRAGYANAPPDVIEHATMYLMSARGQAA